MFKKGIAGLLVCSLLFGAVACGSKETTAAAQESGAPAASTAAASSDTLMLYYSHSTEWADPIIEEFQQTSGIKVELV